MQLGQLHQSSVGDEDQEVEGGEGRGGGAKEEEDQRRGNLQVRLI